MSDGASTGRKPEDLGVFRPPTADEKARAGDRWPQAAARVPPELLAQWRKHIEDIGDSEGLLKQVVFALGMVVACNHVDEWRQMAKALTPSTTTNSSTDTSAPRPP